MRRTKADRWERLVMKTARRLNAKKETAGFRCEGCLEYQEVVKLLRREHQAVVRAIKKHREWAADGGCSSYYEEALLDVLDILKRVAR